MIEQFLVLAWEMRHIACSNYGVVMRLNADVLTRLREQAVGAAVSSFGAPIAKRASRGPYLLRRMLLIDPSAAPDRPHFGC